MDSKFLVLFPENQIDMDQRKKEIEPQRMLEDHHREREKGEFAHATNEEKRAAD